MPAITNNGNLCISLKTTIVIIISLIMILLIFSITGFSVWRISGTANISDNFTPTEHLHQEFLYYNTFAYSQFTDADYYIDPISKIVVTRQKEGWRNGYSFDLRGKESDDTWRSEFFCEPDTMVFVYNNNSYQRSYLPYLLWIDDVYLTNNIVVVGLVHMYNFGNISSLLPSGTMNNFNNIPLDIEEIHSHELGMNYVKTEILIRNRGSETFNVVYVYQDAAYLWFPRGNQSGIEPVFYRYSNNASQFDIGNYRSAQLEPGDSVFSGYVDRDHGIITGIFSNQGWSKVGLINDYIGLESNGISNPSNGESYQIVNNMTFYYDNIPTSNIIYGDQNANILKNRYVAFNINDLHPGESRSVYFYRIMYHIPDQTLDNSTLLLKIKEGIDQVNSSHSYLGDLPKIV